MTISLTDPLMHRNEPYRLDIFAASIKDGRDHQLHRRLFAVRPKQAKPNAAQMEMAAVLNEARQSTPGTAAPADEELIEGKVERIGTTVLDRIHQSVLPFAGGRNEALKRFLSEDGVGSDQRFWRLAQALSALYPSHAEEKRWVDGILARKKALGF